MLEIIWLLTGGLVVAYASIGAVCCAMEYCCNEDRLLVEPQEVYISIVDTTGDNQQPIDEVLWSVIEV